MKVTRTATTPNIIRSFLFLH